MKKATALIVFFLGFSCLGFSQEKDSINNLTSGKWQIESMEIENETMDLSKENHWMVFSTDGKYEMMLDDKKQVGTWQLIVNKNEIKFDAEKFDGISEIKKLTDKEFLFSISEGDVVYIMALKR